MGEGIFIMYKLFIADDEVAIREGIRCLLDWNAHGYHIVGDASNGKQAYQAILEKQPDMVLLDIRMPGMSGLDVIKNLRENNFNGKIIILSGYSDFSYAQQAIQYGVLYYLTKPIDKNRLKEIITAVKKQLDSDHTAQSTSAHYKKCAYHSIIKDIVKGTSDISALDLSDLHINADSYQIVIYENFRCNNSDISYRFSDLLRVTNQNNHSFDAIPNGTHEIILLKGTFAINKFREFVSRYETHSPMQKNSPLDSIFLAYGRIVTSLDEIPLSYKDATKLIERRFFCEQGQHTIGFDSLPNLQNHVSWICNSVLNEYTNRLYDTLSAFQHHKSAETLHELQTKLYHTADSIDTIKLFLTDLFLQLKERINRTYTNATVPFPSNTEIIHEISTKHYLYEIIFFLTEQFELIISSTGNCSSCSILEDIIYYIEHNYSQNLTLESIAPLFGYNSSYLGKLFHKKMGEGFNAYLERIRIEHSKKLLIQEDMKIYTIAEHVGYRNIDYFYQKFKKYVGQTPAEFRREQRKAKLSHFPNE